MADDLKFRKVEPGDLPRLHEIRIAAFTPIHDGFREQIGEAMFQNQYHDWNQKQGALLDEVCADSNHQTYVVLQGEEIVGFIDVSIDQTRKCGELGLNAVDPCCQGRGVGTAMYAFALEKLKQAGAEMVTVGTGGDAAHLPARLAYEKAGFSQTIPVVYYFKRLI